MWDIPGRPLPSRWDTGTGWAVRTKASRGDGVGHPGDTHTIPGDSGTGWAARTKTSGGDGVGHTIPGWGWHLSVVWDCKGILRSQWTVHGNAGHPSRFRELSLKIFYTEELPIYLKNLNAFDIRAQKKPVSAAMPGRQPSPAEPKQVFTWRVKVSSFTDRAQIKPS